MKDTYGKPPAWSIPRSSLADAVQAAKTEHPTYGRRQLAAFLRMRGNEEATEFRVRRELEKKAIRDYKATRPDSYLGGFGVLVGRTGRTVEG